MIVIPAIPVNFPDGTDAIGPEFPIPIDAIAVVFDGTSYTVYQPGDQVPQPEE